MGWGNCRDIVEAVFSEPLANSSLELRLPDLGWLLASRLCFMPQKDRQVVLVELERGWRFPFFVGPCTRTRIEHALREHWEATERAAAANTSLAWDSECCSWNQRTVAGH